MSHCLVCGNYGGTLYTGGCSLCIGEMSVKRYSPTATARSVRDPATMHDNPTGVFVHYADYAALEAALKEAERKLRRETAIVHKFGKIIAEIEGRTTVQYLRAEKAESALKACVGALVGCKATLEVCYESSTGSLDKVLRDEHLNVVTALAAAREVLK